MIVFKIDPPNTGRLGNQMFQIAATVAHADRLNSVAKFSHWEYNKYMLNPIDDKLDTKYDYIFDGIFHDPTPWLQFEYKPLPYSKLMVLMGFFQSEKYFEDRKSLIINTFKPKNEFMQVVRSAGSEFLNLQNTVALHVRRTDYIQKSEYHPVLSETEYYKEAISKINFEINKNNKPKDPPKSINFVVFSDDIEWCKKNMQDIVDRSGSLHFSAGNSDIVDLYLMAQCKHHIIANSSFSWWGSWLSKNMFENSDGITIAPKNWFGPGLAHYNTKDLYLPEWIQI